MTKPPRVNVNTVPIPMSLIPPASNPNMIAI